MHGALGKVVGVRRGSSEPRIHRSGFSVSGCGRGTGRVLDFVLPHCLGAWCKVQVFGVLGRDN